jgi:anti-sigma regulatory factor (Ser/Thr protein kinase)
LLVDEQHLDDVCVLLLEWAGPVFERHITADLRTLAEVRHDLRRWLADRGLDHRASDDVVLAASEAVPTPRSTAAAASPPSACTCWRASSRTARRAPRVVVQVRDEGQLAAVHLVAERGRGLTIAEALVDHVVVETGDGTLVRLHHPPQEGSIVNLVVTPPSFAVGTARAQHHGRPRRGVRAAGARTGAGARWPMRAPSSWTCGR